MPLGIRKYHNFDYAAFGRRFFCCLFFLNMVEYTHIIRLIQSGLLKGMNHVKCYRCHTTMEKDSFSRTATCPCCGRTVGYRTRSEKRGSYGGGYGGGSGGGDVDFSGCLTVIAIIAAIIILGPLLLLSAIFGDGVWTVAGSILGFLGKALLAVIGFVFNAIGTIIGGILDLIF